MIFGAAQASGYGVNQEQQSSAQSQSLCMVSPANTPFCDGNNRVDARFRIPALRLVTEVIANMFSSD